MTRKANGRPPDGNGQGGANNYGMGDSSIPPPPDVSTDAAFLFVLGSRLARLCNEAADFAQVVAAFAHDCGDATTTRLATDAKDTTTDLYVLLVRLSTEITRQIERDAEREVGR